jgi:transcriptional regulator with XRE-family HTH domain
MYHQGDKMPKTNFTLKAKIIGQFGTQADFALRLKWSRSVVSEVVNGRRAINEKDTKLWAKLLKCPVEELGLVEGK